MANMAPGRAIMMRCYACSPPAIAVACAIALHATLPLIAAHHRARAGRGTAARGRSSHFRRRCAGPLWFARTPRVLPAGWLWRAALRSPRTRRFARDPDRSRRQRRGHRPLYTAARFLGHAVAKPGPDDQQAHLATRVRIRFGRNGIGELRPRRCPSTVGTGWQTCRRRGVHRALMLPC